MREPSIRGFAGATGDPGRWTGCTMQWAVAASLSRHEPAGRPGLTVRGVASGRRRYRMRKLRGG
jgi:hypothetical protein